MIRINTARVNLLAEEIHQLVARATENVVEIGYRLREARKLLKADRDWLRWLRDEFHWSQRTAYNLILVAEAAERDPRILELRSRTAMYLVAGKMQKALEDKGEVLDVALWRQVVDGLLSSDPGAALNKVEMALKIPALRAEAKSFLLDNIAVFASLSGEDETTVLAMAGLTLEERQGGGERPGISASLVESDDNCRIVVWPDGDVGQLDTIVVFPRARTLAGKAWRAWLIDQAVELTGATAWGG